MAQHREQPEPIRVNRAPVLTLWAAIVAEQLGHPWETALTLGRAVAGSSAQAKARRLGIAEEKSGGKEADLAQGAKRKTLSRWPKVLQQSLQPEPLRGHGSLSTRLLWRQRQEPFNCIVGQGVD